MTGDRALVLAMEALERSLARTRAPHMIIGGVAVIARGVRRLTDDVDATVWAPDLDLADLFDVLAAEGITGRIADAKEFAQKNQVLLLAHEPSGTEIDVSLAWLPFEKEALDRADRLLLRGVEAPVARPEDLVVYKAVAWRDKDRADIEQLIRLHAKVIDIQRVRALVAEFAEALEVPERLDELEHLIAKALSR